MIKEIQWPNGTKVYYGVPMSNDYYSDDFFWQILDFDVNDGTSYISSNKRMAYKPFQTSFLESLSMTTLHNNDKAYPNLVFEMGRMKKFSFNLGIENVFHGTLNSSISLDINANDSTPYNIWYPYDEDYTKMMDKVPIGNFIQYGDFPVQVRILKDGQWMDGSESATYNFTNMDYIGNGIYELLMNIEPRGRYMFPLEAGGYRKSVRALPTPQIIMFGDLGDAVHTYTGEDIMSIVTNNPNGWYYDAAVGGVRNNVIGDNQTTQMTINSPSDEITIIFGQESESNYDYCNIYDGNKNLLKSFKGVKSDNQQITLTSNNTNLFIFEYRKDSSNSQGKDAFWIKSLEYFQLPPFPEN